MSQFKTEWMTGIFLDSTNKAGIELANEEYLRISRLDSNQGDVSLSFDRADGHNQHKFLIEKSHVNALTSDILFDQKNPGLWRKTERKKLAIAGNGLTRFDPDYSVLKLTNQDGSIEYELNEIKTQGSKAIASFNNSSLTNSAFEFSIASLNNNIAPYQQITYKESEDDANGKVDSVWPTRPGLGDRYYRMSGVDKADLPKFYLNKVPGSLANESFLKKNASFFSMLDVPATKTILTNQDQLPGVADLLAPKLRPLVSSGVDENKVLVSIVFGPGGTLFGRGQTTLLKPNPRNSDDLKLPPVPDDKKTNWEGTFPHFTLSGTRWFTAKDDLKANLIQKAKDFGEQYKVDMPFDSKNNKSPNLRVQSAIGMRDFYNQYVATLEVDRRVLFRPKGGHSYDDLTIAIPDGSMEKVEIPGSGQSYFKVKSGWTEEWDRVYEDTKKGFVEQGIANFSDFYKTWWNMQVMDPLLEKDGETITGFKDFQDVGYSFPWTGVGYTYDTWNQQNQAEGTSMPPAGVQGPGEFVLLPAPKNPTADYWDYKVVSVQSINQFLKDSDKPEDLFPGLNFGEAGTDSSELSLNIKRLGEHANTLYIYECDPITGSIWTGPSRDPDPGNLSQWLNPDDKDNYRSSIVSAASSPSDDKFLSYKIDSSMMPKYGRGKDLDLKLDSLKNWGLLLQRPDGSFASSYDLENNAFISLAGNNSPQGQASNIAVAYGIEDLRLTSAGCDFDFNDIILTMKYV